MCRWAIVRTFVTVYVTPFSWFSRRPRVVGHIDHQYMFPKRQMLMDEPIFTFLPLNYVWYFICRYRIELVSCLGYLIFNFIVCYTNDYHIYHFWHCFKVKHEQIEKTISNQHVKPYNHSVGITSKHNRIKHLKMYITIFGMEKL